MLALVSFVHLCSLYHVINVFFAILSFFFWVSYLGRCYYIGMDGELIDSWYFFVTKYPLFPARQKLLFCTGGIILYPEMNEIRL